MTCGCWKCHEERGEQIRFMIVCATCGNKRCPHAADHSLTCTGSNETGQAGSAYEHGSGAATLRRMTAPDSTPTEREAGDVGEVAAVLAAHVGTATMFCHACPEWRPEDPHGDEGEWMRRHQAEMLAPLMAERERAAGARALREADVVLIDDDTAIGLAMQENALLAGLRGPWEVVTPREHWRLYRRMVPETREVDL